MVIRRIEVLEGRMSAVEIRQREHAEQLTSIEAMRNQISGMVSLVKFVGISGVIASATVALKYLLTKP